MTIYQGHLKTTRSACMYSKEFFGTLFVGGSKIKEVIPGYEDYEPTEYYEQEPLEQSIAKLRKGVESLGVKVLSIELDDFDPEDGTVKIMQLLCKYTGSKQFLDEMLGDEVYIRTGIYYCDLDGMSFDYCPFYLTEISEEERQLLDEEEEEEYEEEEDETVDIVGMCVIC